MYSRQGSRQASYGTEDDPVNCSFFLRMGACRHGENCPKKHPNPPFSQTIMFEHLWIAPKKVLKDKRKRDAHYEDFYEDVLEECLKFGEIEDLLVVSNMGDHMIGNVFVRFSSEEVAEKAVTAIRGRYYAGRRVYVNFSPVQDFAHSRCNDYQANNCMRGQYCNFAHYMHQPKWAAKFFVRPDVNRRYRHLMKKKSTGRDSNGPSFPIRGSSQERKRCISEWNRIREEAGTLKTFERPENVPVGKSGLNLYKPSMKDEEKKEKQ